MISIIICSRHKEINKDLAFNIKSTIGNVAYEIIWINNSNNSYSIFTAYNEGVKKAKYNYLCFMHEDIIFHSANWGEIINNIFYKNSIIGMIGVVGGCYISHNSISWYSSYPYTLGKLYQGKNINGSYQKIMENFNNDQINHNYVKTIDGLFMVIPNKLFTTKEIYWDSNTYKGFHLYDFDMSMQINSLGYQIYVTNDILIEHKSSGCTNKQYYDNLIKFHKKWINLLPQSSIEQKAITKEFINDLAIKPFEEIVQLKKIIDNQNKLLNSTPYKILTKIILSIRNFFL